MNWTAFFGFILACLVAGSYLVFVVIAPVMSGWFYNKPGLSLAYVAIAVILPAAIYIGMVS